MDLGFREDIGEPCDQIADYRLTLKGGKCIHAMEFRDCFCFHWDWVDPCVNLIEHLRQDSPGWYTLSCGLTGGGLFALLSSRSKRKDIIAKSFIAGLIVGGIFGALTAKWE